MPGPRPRGAGPADLKQGPWSASHWTGAPTSCQLAAVSSSSSQSSIDPDELARRHYENFPVGSFLLPRKKRVHVHRLYAFARTADDIADELRDRDALAAWRTATELALEGASPPRVPQLLSDLASTVKTEGLDSGLLFRLLDAFDRDLVQDRYRDREDLASYCRDSADPVGRLMLQLFDCATEDNELLSDSICTGLQVLNHAQDVRKDWKERQRIYLPATMLAAHEVTIEDFDRDVTSPGLRACVGEFADWARAGLREGWSLPRRIGGRFGLELASIVSAASIVLERLDACDYDVFTHRPRLHKRDFPKVLARALRRKAPTVLLRKS